MNLKKAFLVPAFFMWKYENMESRALVYQAQRNRHTIVKKNTRLS